MSDLEDEIQRTFDLQEQLRAMPEFTRLGQIKLLGYSKRLFDANAKELVKKLEWAKQPVNFTQLWMVGNRPLLRSFQFNVVRLLQNFITSAKVLVEHSRRFYSQNYKDSGTFDDFEEQKRIRFIENPTIQFVHYLRNYYEHYMPTFVSVSLSGTNDGTVNHRICLDKKTLELWTGWKKSARDFLNGCDEEIVILDLVRDYCKQIDEFYDWLNARLYEIHELEYKKVGAIQEQINAIVSKEYPDQIRNNIKLIEEGRGDPEDLFGDVVHPDTFNDILEIESWRERMQLFLAESQRERPLPHDIVQHIISIFEKKYAGPED